MPTTVTIGQKAIKEALFSHISIGKVPHAQCFIDSGGRGGLALALDCAFSLLYAEIPDSIEKALQHPDLQFVFPVATSESVKSKPSCADYMPAWRSFVAESVYGDLREWLNYIGAENKQGNIGVTETERLTNALSLKAYLGKNKVCILWGVEQMNLEASNKLLKLIEEPPKDTYFFFIVDDEETLLPTIRSRCQQIPLPPIPESTISEVLATKGSSAEEAERLAREAGGDLRLAMEIQQNESRGDKMEAKLIECLRCAFRAGKNKAIGIELMQWSNSMGQLGRNEQKAFLSFGLRFLRQALLLSYQTPSLMTYQSRNSFSMEKFAPYVHSQNALALVRLFEDGLFAIERNANGKILFADFCIQLTRLLNTKEN